MERRRSKAHLAKGTWAEGKTFRSICVRLDDETFYELRDMAEEREVSMASVVREIIELGLETRKME